MRFSFANAWNAQLLDTNYANWRRDPSSVDASWAAFFEGFEFGSANQKNGADAVTAATAIDLSLQTRVDGLVYAYRTLGHTIATLDPLEETAPEQPLLSLEELKIKESELDTVVSSRYFLKGKQFTVRDLIETLKKIYSSNFGVEFMHIQNPKVRNWLRERIENRDLNPPVNPAAQKFRLRSVLKAEKFEQFLHTRFVGQKRFSLQGGESLMVILNTVLEKCPALGVSDIIMGMAHRGRLTVLANFLHKTLEHLFTEFSENYIPHLDNGDGDVKYHLGYETIRNTAKGDKVNVNLAPNPSHLEAVDPVVEGKARARQRILGDTEERSQVLPLLIHGDAAFAGQGLVAEVLNMSQLTGYETGGTLHIIVNNQIGFTTLPPDARSTTYCTDVAKMIEAPIFHVNGDDPDAVALVTELAIEFRQEFKRDVVVDMYCYRRYGHNEGDEPAFTQPNLYTEISDHPSVSRIYRDKLTASGSLSPTEIDDLEKLLQSDLETALTNVKTKGERTEKGDRQSFAGSTAIFQPTYTHATVDTSISKETLTRIVNALVAVPEGFRVQPKIKRILLDPRAKALANGGPYDWAFAEALAFGALLTEGVPVRLSGQDSRRGTFSQRHSVLYDAETRERHIPLKALVEGDARFCVYNSFLSEAAVLGFDYGYSLDYPTMLTLWEAQFGDFANGAQVIIDQFIVSSESKWQRPSGLVMLLPHGYEGQGPEHSSARLERFLQLCAEDNIQVANLSTPAQYFHILRRQVKRDFRKPLILMTPKSLLRNELCVSREEDFTGGSFQEILDAPLLTKPELITRVIFCSGKVYYDLFKYREANKITNTAFIRIEQLYPVALEKLDAIVDRYENATRYVWCQEEPRNMGAWTHIAPYLSKVTAHGVAYAGRHASASTAVGSKAWHDRQQKELIEEAFRL
ncbi:MAG TPA: 2-oxoglutarate dehydrogenase E1 component [Chthoniobacterales bacterium]